jgi:hypothetical protein
MATSQTPNAPVFHTWIGNSPLSLARGDAARASAKAQSRPPRWPPARLAAVSALWGDGFNGPGGPAETLNLAAPLALNMDDKLLLLGGGIGGPACTIADHSGAWIANFEADGEVAALARERACSHSSGHRIVVESWNPQVPDFGIRCSSHAMLLEALRGGDPVRTLESLARALRPRSRIVMTEMVADRQAPPTDREFAAWCRLENRQCALPRGETITAALTRLRYDVQVVEDISAAHVSAALAGWRGAAKAMAEGAAPSAASASVIVTEAELWLLRIRLMRRFGFRLLRWHAIGAGGRAILAAATPP